MYHRVMCVKPGEMFSWGAGDSADCGTSMLSSLRLLVSRALKAFLSIVMTVVIDCPGDTEIGNTSPRPHFTETGVLGEAAGGGP